MLQYARERDRNLSEKEKEKNCQYTGERDTDFSEKEKEQIALIWS